MPDLPLAMHEGLSWKTIYDSRCAVITRMVLVVDYSFS
jgi:hypothetical protein